MQLQAIAIAGIKYDKNLDLGDSNINKAAAIAEAKGSASSPKAPVATPQTKVSKDNIAMAFLYPYLSDTERII